jgi:hypothetical protein
VSSRARDRAAPEARSWALALQTKRRGKVKASFRFDFSFLDAMLTFSLFRSTDLFAFD